LSRPRLNAAAAALVIMAAIAAAAAAEKAAPAAARPEIVILNARVHPVSGPVLEEGSVLVRDGRIAQVGERVDAGRNAIRIDGRGKTVVPGFIDAYTRLGLVEISMVTSTVDDDEGSEPMTPQVRALDAFNPLGRAVAYAREHGITSALVGPRAGGAAVNVVAGQSAVLRLHGTRADDMVMRSPAGLHVTIGEGPKNRYNDRKKMPVSRMGEVALLRAALAEGKDYADAWRRHEDKRAADPDKAKAPDRDLRKEAMAEALAGRLPVYFHCHRADDILAALRVAKEFGLKAVLVHATEGHRVVAEIAAARVPVIVGPVSTTPNRLETLEATPESAAILARAGVPIAITTADSHLVSHLPFEAGLAAAHGLPEDQALRAITLGAAEILGIADRVGSIQPGKEADLVILDGDPLEITTRVEWVVIRGEMVYRRGA
jgi:imidazolonepropionase-like amidohydrolase